MPNSPIDTFEDAYAVAVHDAGAANMIAAWVGAAQRAPEMVVAQGPARAIWQQRFGTGSRFEGDPERVQGAKVVISGTGWASDLEHRARAIAAEAGVRSVAVVDHWVNYKARFERDGVTQWPDAIWVGDDEALAIARRTFPKVPADRHANLYLAQQAREAGPAPKDGDVLFVSEPAHSDWGGDRAGEFQALDHFMASRQLAGIRRNAAVRLRPHPSDPSGKYDEWLSNHPTARLDTSPDMATALQTAKWVVGMNSMGLVIALQAGRKVLCALPPCAPPCALPHRGILSLRTIPA
ncbi:MAG: hypothetical protein AAFN04_11930 [Pseudomonadota bacterium]